MDGAGGFVILLLVGLAALWLAVVLITVRMLTRPPRRTYASALARGKPGDPGELPTPRAFSSWSLTVPGGELPVWDIPGDAPGSGSGRVIVAMVHGWGDSKIGALSRLGAVLPVCARVVAVDLPGHGEAGPRPRFTLGVREPEVCAALVRELRRQEPEAAIVLHGWSLGAGAAVAAAGREDVPVAGVIAESLYRVPPTPARGVLTMYGLPHRATLRPALLLLALRLGQGAGEGLSWTRFDRAARARDLRARGVRLLVLHGSADEICPPEDGRAVAEAGGGELIVLDRKGHTDLWSGTTTPEAVVRSYLESLARGPVG